MNKKNLYLKNFNYIEKIKKKDLILEKKFNKIHSEITRDKKKKTNIFHNFTKDFIFNFNLKELTKFGKFNSCIVIGMGGSILGSEAIYQFLHHKIKKDFYFINDLDENYILKLEKKLNFKNTLFLIISKSGNTIETLSNLLRLNILKKKQNNIIVISEKKNNLLYTFTKKFNLFYVEHKNYIGGRYSVLSEVGVIPAYFMGLDILKLRKNLEKYLLKNKLLKESSIQFAKLLMSKKYNTLVFLNYSPRLEKFLFWCQQLLAESLGKKRMGFLPIVSSVPKDHHSLLQLYLDGPKNKLFHFLSIEEKNKKKLKVKKFGKQIKFLNNKNLNQIKIAQKNALIKVFKKNQIPYKETVIKNLNEETLGELFSYFMIETIIVGKLININPFSQPSVEQVKIFTKKLLS